MQLELSLRGEDSTENTLYSLQDWIKNEQISSLKSQIKTGPPKEGHMGIDPITVLSVVLASAAVVELVKSIHVWIQATRPKLKVKIQISETKFIEIDSTNLPDAQSLTNDVLKIVKDLED